MHIKEKAHLSQHLSHSAALCILMKLSYETVASVPLFQMSFSVLVLMEHFSQGSRHKPEEKNLLWHDKSRHLHALKKYH